MCNQNEMLMYLIDETIKKIGAAGNLSETQRSEIDEIVHHFQTLVTMLSPLL